MDEYYNAVRDAFMEVEMEIDRLRKQAADSQTICKLQREVEQANANILNLRAFIQELESVHQGTLNELAEAMEALGNANREAKDYKFAFENEFANHKDTTKALVVAREALKIKPCS